MVGGVAPMSNASTRGKADAKADTFGTSGLLLVRLIYQNATSAKVRSMFHKVNNASIIISIKDIEFSSGT